MTMEIYSTIVRSPDVSRECLKLCPWTFWFFHSFYQSIVLSSRAVDGHQMYFGGSVVGKALTIGIGISPNPPLIFTGVKRCEIRRRSKLHSTLSRPRLKMQQDIWILKQKCNAAMIVRCPRISEKALSVLTQPPKLHAKTR